MLVSKKALIGRSRSPFFTQVSDVLVHTYLSRPGSDGWMPSNAIMERYCPRVRLAGLYHLQHDLHSLHELQCCLFIQFSQFAIQIQGHGLHESKVREIERLARPQCIQARH